MILRHISSISSFHRLLHVLRQKWPKVHHNTFQDNCRASDYMQPFKTFQWTIFNVLYVIGNLEEVDFPSNWNQSNPFSESDVMMKLLKTCPAEPNQKHHQCGKRTRRSVGRPPWHSTKPRRSARSPLKALWSKTTSVHLSWPKEALTYLGDSHYKKVTANPMAFPSEISDGNPMDACWEITVGNFRWTTILWKLPMDFWWTLSR